MQQLKDTYQSYLNLHQNFNEEHKSISRQITDLYQLPKNFMEENEKAIQMCLSDRKPSDAPHHVELSYHGMRDFLFIVEDFKLQTMELFFEHRVHIDKCTIYVMKVAEIQEKQAEKEIIENEEDYIMLIPQLDELRGGLITLLEKAQAMANRLAVIQERWLAIQSKDI